MTRQQWIFIVEGALTILLAVAAFFLIPGSIEATSWLTSQEKQVVQHYIAHDGNLRIPMDDSFDWDYVKAAFLDWKLYTNLGQYFTCLATVCMKHSLLLHFDAKLHRFRRSQLA